MENKKDSKEHTAPALTIGKYNISKKQLIWGLVVFVLIAAGLSFWRVRNYVNGGRSPERIEIDWENETVTIDGEEARPISDYVEEAEPTNSAGEPLDD